MKKRLKNCYGKGSLKKCPIGHKAIDNLIKRSHTDIKTAKRNISEDEECAYTYSYNALLRSGLALMFSKGYRPEIKNKHLTVVKFTNAVLGKEYEDLINDYDFMRKKRHKFVYEPDIPCSLKEAKDAIHTAQGFVNKISKIIKLSSPQKKIDF